MDEYKKAENEAVEFATRAISFDQQNMYDAAIYYYRAAAQALHSAYLLGSQLAGVKEKADEYIKRAEDLHKIKIQINQKRPEKNEQKLELDRAEFLLKQGLDEDEAGNEEEAVELYLQAAELCLKARKLTPDKNLSEKLKNLAANALDRAEILKGKHKKSQESSPDHVSPSSSIAGISNLRINESINEKQILVNKQPALPMPSPTLPHQSGGGTYTKEEIAVLKITSIINGREYVPFMSIDLREKFAYPISFSDKDGKLALSPKQKAAFARWVRPEDISSRPVLIEVIDCFSIKQTIVSDCSFIASLAVSALYEKRFRKKIITSIIYPQNRAGDPVYNPCGKYMIKMHINGVPRKIIIDDHLPMGSHGELLCSYSSNKNEFWISLLEKAYMKVMGGYDFPGSNSNIDLHALTGWIPERISIDTSDPTFAKDKIFNMLVSKHNKGDVLITVATGEISQVEADRSGLVPTHAYALLDIKEVLGKRLCLLKNPWSHLRWKGRYSEHDTKNWTPQLKATLRYDPSNAQMFDNGVFWIDYDSLLHFYNVIYLNWNPELFKYTYCLHQMWKAGTGPVKDLYNIGDNPQFCLDLKSSGSTIWVLLTRHIVDRDDFAENKEFIALIVYKNEGRKVYIPTEPEPYIDGVKINSPHYLCKIVVPQGGTTRYTLVMSQYEKTEPEPYIDGVKINSPHYLCKIVVPQGGTTRYTLVMSQYEKTEPEPYIDGVKINSPHYLCKIVVPQGGTTRYTLVMSQYEKTEPEPYIDGVKINSPHYLCKIVVPQGGTTRYTLVMSQYEKTEPEPYIDGVKINSPHYLCKIVVPQGGTTRYTLVMSQYEKTEPEPYIDGVRINSPHYLCKIVVPQGGTTRYTLVMSQYEKSSTIFYTLRAYATCPFTLSNIKNVFKHKQEIKNGEWTEETAGGCANNPQTYHKNPIYQISLNSPSDDNHLLIDLKGPKQYYVGFEIVAVTVNNSSSPTYFSRKSSGPFRSGFTILEILNVPSGIYNIIPSTFAPGQKGPFFLTVQSSCPIKISRLK